MSDVTGNKEESKQNETKCSPICLALGGAGAFFASIAELTAKQEISTIVRVKDCILTYLNVEMSPIYVVVMFVVFGIIFTYINQVSDLKKSFYIGASIISIFVTIIPNDLKPSAGEVPSPMENSSSWGGFSTSSQAFAREAPGRVEKIRLDVMLVTKDNRPVREAIISLRDMRTKRLLATSKFVSERFSLYLKKGNYLIVVEVPGYRAKEKEITVDDANVQKLSVELEPTWAPLPLQRLFRSR